MVQQPIYFLPGTMCDERLWADVFTYLPSDIAPIYIELPLAEDFDSIIAQLAARLPSTPFNLVGFSLGGYIAALFALHHPQRINQLLISANSPSALPLIEIKQRKMAISAVETYGYQGLPQTKILSMLATSNETNQKIIATIAAMDNAGGAKKLLSQLSATSARKNLCPQLMKLSIPIHFVYGAQDKLVTAAKINEICNDQITSTVLSDCGHMSPLESPQTLAQEISYFFSSHHPGTSNCLFKPCPDAK